ncbi:MAG: hypothetical protein NUV70_03300 [Caldiserica bacterium]|jgi:hypothetical protein|nr:hypothetical protein [Caldisericota bacterium]
MEIPDQETADRFVSILREYLEEVEVPDPWIYFKGRGRLPLSPKFNVVIYRNSKGKFKIVSTDDYTLLRLLNGEGLATLKEERVDIDDAGTGCPIGGVLIGVYHHGQKKFLWREIELLFFQSPFFEEKKYLDEAARVTLELLEQLHASPENTMIYICSGHIHTKTKEILRNKGYEVLVTEIKQPLQDLLENALKDYLKSNFGFEGFFDPKKDDPREGFINAKKWLKEDPERIKFAKTGWRYFKNSL